MEDETYKVRTFLEGVAQCGAAQAFAMLEPASDLLSQRKAYAFLKAHDTRFGGQWEHGEAWLAQQVAEGAVKPVRRGHHKNSPCATVRRSCCKHCWPRKQSKTTFSKEQIFKQYGDND